MQRYTETTLEYKDTQTYLEYRGNQDIARIQKYTVHIQNIEANQDIAEIQQYTQTQLEYGGKPKHNQNIEIYKTYIE